MKKFEQHLHLLGRSIELLLDFQKFAIYLYLGGIFFSLFQGPQKMKLFKMVTTLKKKKTTITFTSLESISTHMELEKVVKNHCLTLYVVHNICIIFDFWMGPNGSSWSCFFFIFSLSWAWCCCITWLMTFWQSRFLFGTFANLHYIPLVRGDIWRAEFERAIQLLCCYHLKSASCWKKIEGRSLPGNLALCFKGFFE